MTRAPMTSQRGGPVTPHQHQQPCWPKGLTVRPFLAPPRHHLNRLWQAWTDKDPPSELQALLDAVAVGHGLDLYCRI